MQTTVQQSSSIRLGSGILKIAGVNVGLLQKAKLTTKFNVLSVKADNGRMPPFKRIESATFGAELFEVYLANIQAIDTFGVLTSVAASPVTVTAEAHGTGWTVGTPIKATYKNGANTIVTSIVVKQGSTTLAAGTDYRTYVADGTNGDAGYTYIVPITAQTNAITFGYSYTPYASNTITYSDIIKLVGYYDVTFENTDGNGKKFTINFPKGYSSSDLTMEFMSDDKIDSAMSVPFEVTAFPNPSNVMFSITDEQAP